MIVREGGVINGDLRDSAGERVVHSRNRARVVSTRHAEAFGPVVMYGTVEVSGEIGDSWAS